MTSPFVRRRRLAAELRTFREERGLTADELAQRLYLSRTKISKLENAHVRPDLAEVMKILDLLEVTGERLRQQTVLCPDGPDYEVILDEVGLRRYAVPPGPGRHHRRPRHQGARHRPDPHLHPP